MQWLIDIIFNRVMANMTGTIVIWSGAIVDVPDGWHLCDGTNGTPDLRNRFIIGAGTTHDPDDTGGALIHTHSFTTDGHDHTVLTGKQFGGPMELGRNQTSIDQDTGIVDSNNHLPPYYALAYIMKV